MTNANRFSDIQSYADFRKIIHIDMDAFYASVEQRDNPELRGKPLAVGGNRERGVVAAASYEARKFGVRSAMPSITAAKKCPELIFVRPRFEVYKNVSAQIHSIFAEFTDLIEPLALDEAYLDVTENKQGLTLATDVAKAIKKRIKDVTELNASAGISMNKFLAKLASDHDKPDGLYVITPKMAERFVEKLPIERFHGVGKVTAQKMHKIGIHFGADLKKFPLESLSYHFGKAGTYYYNIARAIDHREVNPNRIRKSLGSESTFSEDIIKKEALHQKLDSIAERVYQRMQSSRKSGRTLTLKVKFADFQQITRSKTMEEDYSQLDEIKSTSKALLEELGALEKGIRLLGISISNFEKPEENIKQLTLDF